MTAYMNRTLPGNGTYTGTAPGHRAVQPMDHDDLGRRYRHAFNACMIEAGHIGARFVVFGPHAPLRVWWETPPDSIDWTPGQFDTWCDAADRAEALCEALLGDNQ